MWRYSPKQQHSHHGQDRNGRLVSVADLDEDPSLLSLTSICSSANKIDSLLANELYNMSVDDRNRIQEELHGVVSLAPNETPQVMDDALTVLRSELDAQIQNLATSPPQDTSWSLYLQAILMPVCQLYVKSHELCIKYLRADRLNPRLAASRMIRHLGLLFKYFGQVALFRPLRLSDLSKQEQDVFRAGNNQVLLSRDRSGRLVVFSYGSMPAEGLSDASRLRVLLYFFCCLSEDVETQKKGYVSIAFPDRSVFEMFNSISNEETRQDWKDYMNNDYKPVRLSAFHLIHPEGPVFQLLKAFWVVYCSRNEDRAKVKFYTNLETETQYQLLTYGIPIQDLPLTVTGTLKTKNHLLWVKSRKLIDQARQKGQDISSMGTFHPGMYDVLFSRGGNVSHFGNMEFRQIIASRIQAYNAGGRKERTVIRNQMIATVHEKGGRFLMLQTDGWWIELSNEKNLIEKVTNAVYDFNRRSVAQGRRIEYQSETMQFLDGNKRRRIENGDISDTDQKMCF